MPLIRCPECGKEVSDKARGCPHCGYPLESAGNQRTMSLGAPAQEPDQAEATGQKNPNIESRLVVEIPPWEKEDLGRFKDIKVEAPKVIQSRINIPPLLKRALLIGGGLAFFMMALSVSGAFDHHPVVKHPAPSLEESLPKEPPKPVVYQPPKEDRGSEEGAFAVAKDMILALIPTPSTADFSLFNSDIVEVSPYKWRVKSYVDFQNLFGAMVRKHFIVDLTYRSGKWYCDNIDIY